MGLAKRAMLEDDGYKDFLQQVLDGGHLDGAAAGITKKVIAEGEETLSAKQRYVFQTQVLDEFVTDECVRCGSDIPWSEMYIAYDSDMCSWCEHMTSKDD